MVVSSIKRSWKVGSPGSTAFFSTGPATQRQPRVRLDLAARSNHAWVDGKRSRVCSATLESACNSTKSRFGQPDNGAVGLSSTRQKHSPVRSVQYLTPVPRRAGSEHLLWPVARSWRHLPNPLPRRCASADANSTRCLAQPLASPLLLQGYGLNAAGVSLLPVVAPLVRVRDSSHTRSEQARSRSGGSLLVGSFLQFSLFANFFRLLA